MSIGFFIVGGIIFSVYMYLTIWNIFYSNKKQRQENYPNLGSEGCDEVIRPTEQIVRRHVKTRKTIYVDKKVKELTL